MKHPTAPLLGAGQNVVLMLVHGRVKRLLYHGCRLVHFVYNTICPSLIAMELEKLLLNNKNPPLCKTKMSPKHYFKPYICTNNKNKLWKTVRLTSFQKTKIAICFNLLLYLLCYLYFLFMFSVIIFLIPLNLVEVPNCLVSNQEGLGTSPFIMG